MMKFFCLALFFILYLSASAQIIPKSKQKPEPPPLRYFFGFRLQPTHNDLITYAIVHVLRDSTKEFQIVSKSNFIMQATGQQQSKANPRNINFLEQYEIKWQTFDELWKLRYAMYPYHGNNSKGYTKHDFLPSTRQFSILSKYGIHTLNDFCYGDSAFLLLQSLQNPNWVAAYQETNP